MAQNFTDLEILTFATPVSKITRKQASQPRSLLFSNLSLYNIKDSKNRHKIEGDKIEAIIMSKTSHEFVLRVLKDRDYRLQSPQRWQIYEQIKNLSKNFVQAKPPLLYLVDSPTLEGYTRVNPKAKLVKQLSSPVDFDSHPQPNLGICNLLQTDHRVLYLRDRNVFEIHPDNFKTELKLGYFTELVKNTIGIASNGKNNQFFIRKTIPKQTQNPAFLPSVLRKRLSAYSQNDCKEEIHFILENPDSFIIFSKPYRHSLIQKLNNYQNLTEKDIKGIFTQILTTVLLCEHKHIYLESILYDSLERLVIAQFDELRVIPNRVKRDYLSPEEVIDPEKQHKKTLIWKLGAFLYKLVYGIPPVPSHVSDIRNYFSMFDNAQPGFPHFPMTRNPSVSAQLVDFMRESLQIEADKRFQRYEVKGFNSQNPALNMLKHVWLTP